jgi:hypothetical protein
LDFLGADAAAAIHAAAHAFLNQFPMAGDLRTECPVPEKEMSKKESSRKRPGRYVLQLERQAGRRSLNPRTVLSFTTLPGEVRVVLPPRHLITVSESPGHYGPRDIYTKHSTKHPTFSFVPWKLSVPAIVWMREAVRTVSSLYCHL